MDPMYDLTSWSKRGIRSLETLVLLYARLKPLYPVPTASSNSGC